MFNQYKKSSGVRGERQRVRLSNNPATVNEGEILRVKFPNLGDNDLIIPGTSRLAFSLSLTGTDDNRTIVQNIGRALVSRICIRIAGNEVFALDDANIYHCYNDLWLPLNEKKNLQYRGIDVSDKANVTKLRIGAADKDDTVVKDKNLAKALSNRFYIPLDFEILDTDKPYHQRAYGENLEYELTINRCKDVIKSSNADAKFKIENITLEFEQVTDEDAAREVRRAYNSGHLIYYDRIYRHKTVPLDKSDPIVNIDMNFAAKSLKGVLLLFKEAEADFTKDSEKFYNPKIEKVDVTINGRSNQLFSSGLLAHNQYEEARKMFAGGLRKNPHANDTNKELHNSDLTMDKYYTDKFALWLDFRSYDKDHHHNTGRELRNTGDSIVLQIKKEVETAGTLQCHVFVVLHAEIKMSDNKYNASNY